MSPAIKKPETEKVIVKENERKWSRNLMAAGWTAMPSIILERQRAFDLDAVDVNILLHIVRHWWRADELPFPSKRIIAEAMNVDPRTVQRRIAAMERDGLLRRKKRYNTETRRQKSNEYDLSGLIEAAQPYAKEKIDAKEDAKKKKDEQRLRKRPLMKIAD